MINLMRNELIKILKKKSTYIILFITIGIIILFNFMFCYSSQSSSFGYTDEDVAEYEELLNDYDVNNPEENSIYIDIKSKADMMKLIVHYGVNSWQAYVISDISQFLEVMNEYEYSIDQTVSEKEYQEAKQNYSDFIQKLDSDDWQYFVTSELEEVNNQIALQENSNTTDDSYLNSLNVEKQILEWRLDKNISYASSFLNDCLHRYESNAEVIFNYEHSDEHDYSDTLNYYNCIEALNTCKYYIENEINFIRSNDNRSILLELLDNYELFILIFFVMIAGSIVSDEFNKGTIKLLLVRPYRRSKILLSKFLVCIISMLLFIAIVGVAQFIIGGFIQGFESTTVPAVVYNFNTQQIETMPIILYILITLLAKLPMYILLMTLAFACSTVLNHTAVSIVIPLLGYMGTSIINELALAFDIKAILYFVTPNWDFTQYLFGHIPNFEGLQPIFSIGICLIYFAIMLVTMFTVFQKRNIKNI